MSHDGKPGHLSEVTNRQGCPLWRFPHVAEVIAAANVLYYCHD
ncbi:MAG: hypothetical protein ABF615_13055 [Gluconobacter oxydans]